MKNIIKKVSQAVQVLLLAPIKLPAKVMQVLKYIAVGLGIVETVIDNDQKEDDHLLIEEQEVRDEDNQ